MNGRSATVARLAPSPTGAQHLGNARTFLLAWLSVRSQGGHLILRIEDIDSPRIKTWAQQQAIDDLHWLGLEWDEGPDRPGQRGPYVQTQRTADYLQALAELRQREQIYPCTCSRNDVAQAASAPHWEHEGPVYPGLCVHRSAPEHETITDAYAWRFRCLPGIWRFTDGFRGPQSCDIAQELGDFVVAKHDGSPAYQLAVVVDDHAMQVTEVVRGDDLLASTFRQLQLYHFWSWQPPQFFHVPLVVGTDGRRLAKRHGDTRLSHFHEIGVKPQRIVGLLAYSLGLLDEMRECTPYDLLPRFDWRQVQRQDRWVFDEQAQQWLTG